MKIKSGLGNQMFQYALGRRLSLDWQDELKVDFSWFTETRIGETPRDLEINKFNISLVQATPTEVLQSMGSVAYRVFKRAVGRIRGRFDRNYFFRFHPSILHKQKRVYLDGYFQSYKYFELIKSTLLGEFTLKNDYSAPAREIKSNIQQVGQSLGMHIRRGDYVTTCKDWNGLCGADYYKNGLAEILKKYQIQKIFVFSDDIDWARENLRFDLPTFFVSRPELSAVEELLLMSVCKHQIIANSTFSWWSAWLNRNENKIVIAPSRWLLASDIDTSDLLPVNWIKI